MMLASAVHTGMRTNYRLTIQAAIVNNIISKPTSIITPSHNQSSSSLSQQSPPLHLLQGSCPLVCSLYRQVSQSWLSINSTPPDKYRISLRPQCSLPLFSVSSHRTACSYADNCDRSEPFPSSDNNHRMSVRGCFCGSSIVPLLRPV